MPELPDVEVQKRYLDSTSLHQKIESVEVNDPIVLEELTPSALGRALADQSFESTQRHGKHLFAKINDDKWLGLHFGMTGWLKYFKNEEENPKYDQVLFDFKNGYHLAYVVTRKLGRIRVIKSVDDFIEDRELGPDALGLDFHEFHELLAGHRGMIKSTLMNQSILAGLGNVYTDEILFQAKIHPRKKTNKLEEDELRHIFNAMSDVLETAIDCQTDPKQFPDSFITPHRSEEDDCPRCGGKIQRTEVSGRGSYFCPRCQG